MDNTDVLKNEISEMQKEHDTNANEIEELYEVIEGLEEEKKELQEEIERQYHNLILRDKLILNQSEQIKRSIKTLSTN